nr:acyl-CoA--sterol O-acyltransferase 1-like [Ipomoea batatas]
MYLFIDIILALVAALARAVLGLELEPTFNEPYLSSSLQDFWGSRWNLMVNRILRPAVYSPFLDVSDKYLGRKWATYPAVIATFMVSGLMHELIYFYLSRVRPTWEVTWFFLLHGACVALEIAVKKALRGRCRLPGILGTILTLGFFTLTVCWLFLPQLLRCDVLVKVLAEYAALGSFVKDVGQHRQLSSFVNETEEKVQKHQTLILSPNELFREKPVMEVSENRQKSAVSYAVKTVLMGLIIRIYEYSDSINPTAIQIIHCLHIYLFLDIILRIVAALARAVLGLELEPQFNEPYLCSSLQDFWGNRWNLMVNHILRPAVYSPCLGIAAKYLGRGVCGGRDRSEEGVEG